MSGFDTCFSGYVRWLLRRSFARVWLRLDAALPSGGGYVAVANHSSWWDGFVPYFLHRACNPKRAFAILMSARELHRFPFFRFGGAFSIDLTSMRTAHAAIRYAGEEARGGAGVWIFPQGELARGADWRPFTSGFVHAARFGGVPIVPAAMRFVLRTGQRPEVFVDIAAPVDARARTAREDVESCVRERLARIERAIAADDCSGFAPILRAAGGVDDRIGAGLAALRRWRS